MVKSLCNWSPLRVRCFLVSGLTLFWVSLSESQVLLHVEKVSSSVAPLMKGRDSGRDGAAPQSFMGSQSLILISTGSSAWPHSPDFISRHYFTCLSKFSLYCVFPLLRSTHKTNKSTTDHFSWCILNLFT